MKSKENYLKKLNKAFGDFNFFEEDHHYEYKGQLIGISVTRLIEDYTNEFDGEAIAEKVAVRDNKSVQEVLDEWEYKNKFACEKGSTCHEFAQSLWSRKIYYPLKFDDSEEYKMAVAKIWNQFINFHI